MAEGYQSIVNILSIKKGCFKKKLASIAPCEKRWIRKAAMQIIKKVFSYALPYKTYCLKCNERPATQVVVYQMYAGLDRYFFCDECYVDEEEDNA